MRSIRRPTCSTSDPPTTDDLRLVARLAERWGAAFEGEGKVVWAEITGRRNSTPADVSEEDLLAMWDDDWEVVSDPEPRLHVALGEVPTDLLLAAKVHVENVVRELTLASAGARAGLTTEVPAHLASLLSAVVDRFAEARLEIKRPALDAARRGEASTKLSLDPPASAAEATEDYLRALDEVDAYEGGDLVRVYRNSADLVTSSLVEPHGPVGSDHEVTRLATHQLPVLGHPGEFESGERPNEMVGSYRLMRLPKSSVNQSFPSAPTAIS